MKNLFFCEVNKQEDQKLRSQYHQQSQKSDSRNQNHLNNTIS